MYHTSFAERLPLGIRRPLFSRLRDRETPHPSWVLVGSVRREVDGLTVEFHGEFVACEPLWHAVTNGVPSGESVAEVAFGIPFADGIEVVVDGPVNGRVALQSNRLYADWRATRRRR